jgi:prepilin-type N-terminal cleavage/methylation domain-containing protein
MTRLLFINIPSSIRSQKAFTLVELIVTLVLVGIIGTFTTLFMYTGLNGYLRAKDTSEGALKAQIALDRISLELRDIDKIDLGTYSDDARIDYTSVILPYNRKILYNGGVISLDVNGNTNALLDEVSGFTMRMIPRELNYFADNKDEVQAIDISFKVGDIERPFSARIFPRNMVPAEP